MTDFERIIHSSYSVDELRKFDKYNVVATDDDCNSQLRFNLSQYGYHESNLNLTDESDCDKV